MTNLPRVAVGAVVFDDHGRVLLVRRAHPPAPGSWALPGGKVHFGEALTHAVKRELLEETGLAVQPTQLVDVVELIDDAYHFVIHDYLCECASHPALASAGDDASDLAWVGLDRLADYHPSAAVVAVVLRADQLRRASRPGSR